MNRIRPPRYLSRSIPNPLRYSNHSYKSGISISAKQIHKQSFFKHQIVTYPNLLIRNLHTTLNRLAISPFKLHDIGEGITEVEIIKWYVEEGQEVGEFDALCEVQSDKSVVELTSHANGIVKGITKSAGEVVKVGQVLCEIHTNEESDGVEDEPIPTSEDIPEVNDTINPENPTSTTEGNNDGTENETVKQAEEISEELEKKEEEIQNPVQNKEPKNRRHPLLSQDDDHDPIQLQGEASILPSPPSSKPVNFHDKVEPRREGNGNENIKSIIKASPAIRTLASKLDIDLNDIEGTGDGGRITKDDLERFSRSTNSYSNSIKSVFEMEDKRKSSNIDRSKLPEFTKVEFGRTRKSMFKGLSEQGKIPHFGYSHTLNLTPLLPYLKSFNPPSMSAKKGYLASDIPSELVRNPINEEDKQKTTILSLLIKGLILALEEHPIMRSRLRVDNDKKWLEVGRDGIIGVAVSDPKYGLLTPSLPPLPPTTSIHEITSHLTSLRSNPSKPTKPSNITISSVGGLGESKALMPVIPPGGGLAICAVGKASWEMEWNLSQGNPSTNESVWELDESKVKDGGMKAVLRVPVGWSGDHRILEGVELISFTETWKKYIEEPWRWVMN